MNLPTNRATTPFSWREFSMLTALFLVVVGARFWLIDKFGMSLPFCDQWDAEGSSLLKPWLEGHWTFSSLFAAHNEHRIVLTRLLALALFQLNGQWDAVVEMTANAFLCGGIAVLVAGAGWRIFPRSFRWPVLIATAAVFALPYAWENTVEGFQSQFYFLLLFSLIALWGIGLHSPWSRNWWVGTGALLLACLSMASGFFAAAALLGLETLRLLKNRRRPDAGTITTLFFCLVVIAAGLLFTAKVPGHDELKAGSPFVFFSSLFHCLAWPFCQRPAFALIMQTPLLTLAIFYIQKSSNQWSAGVRRQVECILLIGLWCLLQAAAISFARGAEGGPPSSRYMDLLALGTMPNFLALLFFVSRVCPTRPAVIAAAGWIAALVAGVFQLTQTDLALELPARKMDNETQVENVRGYVMTGDFKTWLAGKEFLQIPFPDPGQLAKMLDDPTFRRILPAEVRQPLNLVAIDGELPEKAHLNLDPPVWDLSQLPLQGSFRATVSSGENLPYWRIRFFGEPGPGLTFQIRDQSGKYALNHRLKWKADDRWHVADIAVPAGHGPLEIEATDSSPIAGFAFTAPVEVGALSCWTGWLVRRGSLILNAGLLLGLLASFLSIQAWRAENPSRPMPHEIVLARLARLPNWMQIALFVLLVSVLLFSRRPDQFFHPGVWAEDGVIVLPDSMQQGWKSLFWPVQGYLVLSSRFVTLLSLSFGIESYPFASTLLATAFSVFVLTYIAWTPCLLRGPGWLALSVVFIPTDPECFCLPLFSFWWSGLLLMGIAFRKNHSSRALQASDILLTAFCAISGVLAPLVVLVLIVQRFVSKQLFPGLNGCIVTLLTGSAIQATIYLTHRDEYGAGHVIAGYLSAPISSLSQVVQKFFGNYALLDLSHGSLWRVVLTCAGLALLVAMSIHAVRRRDPIFIYLGLFLAGTMGLSIARINIADTHPLIAGARYYFYPWILLTWWLLIQLQQSRGWTQFALAAVLALAAIRLPHCWQKPNEPTAWMESVQKMKTTGTAEFVILTTSGTESDAWRISLPDGEVIPNRPVDGN